MKLQVPTLGLSPGRSPAMVRGFTLTEILVAMAVFILVVTGIMTAHLFGLRMFQVNQTKLTATEWSRRTFGKITDEIHSSRTVYVGNVIINANTTFEGLIDGETQQGAALLINPTTDTNKFILYFVNPSDQTFQRITDQPGSAQILADSVTNTMIFSAQDIFGNVQTNRSGAQLVHLALEFYQPQLFQQDPYHYRLETSVTRRAVQ